MSALSKILPLLTSREARRTTTERSTNVLSATVPPVRSSAADSADLARLPPLPICDRAAVPPFLRAGKIAVRPPSSYVRPATIPTSDGVSQVARCGHGVLAARTDDDCAAKVLFRAVHGPHEIPSDSPTASPYATQARAPCASPKPSTRRPCRRRRKSAPQKRSSCCPRRIRCR